MAIAVANDLFALVMKDLDDENAIRTTTPELFLRHLSRAQQWVSLRYQLLRETFLFSLYTNTPVYALHSTQPRLVVVTHMTHSDRLPLWRVPLTSLRYKDMAWFATTGTPNLWYRVGWRYLGVYPVPSADETAVITGLIIPAALAEMASPLRIPESYIPQLAMVTTGVLMLARERRYDEGLARIKTGLGIQSQSAGAPSTAPAQEAASVAG